MRKLRFHEKKLLKKVDFIQWKNDQSLKEIKVMRRYMIQNRDDYYKYAKIVGLITKLSHKISLLNAQDPKRDEISTQLIDKLFDVGIISSKSSFSQLEKLTVSSFCRRRLPIVMMRLKMAETLKEAVTFVEQGHIRVGTQTITDPAFMVTRTMEDFTTWTQTSKIKRKIMKYNDKLDDYDLMN